MGKVIYKALSYHVMEAVFEVHNTLGPGFLEQVYEEALTVELQLRAIPFERQKTISVSYKGKVVGRHQIDLIVDNKIILELKAAKELTAVFKQLCILLPFTALFLLGGYPVDRTIRS